VLTIAAHIALFYVKRLIYLNYNKWVDWIVFVAVEGKKNTTLKTQQQKLSLLYRIICHMGFSHPNRKTFTDCKPMKDTFEFG